MAKRTMGPKPLLFPMPAVLVATWCGDGRPDAMTAAWAATCCQEPPCVGVAVRSNRLTFDNLEANDAFTLNVARAADATAVDYLGIVSGRKDPGKVARAGYEVAPAKRVHAPLLVGCPVNLECRLTRRVPLGTHTWFVGEVVEAHVDEDVIGAEGRIDVERLDPLVYCTSARDYHRVGERLAKAFSVGRALKE